MPGTVIPRSALTVSTETVDDYHKYFTTEIKCGDVVVFGLTTNDGSFGHPDFAYDEEDAEKKALEQFGAKLKKVLS